MGVYCSEKCILTYHDGLGLWLYGLGLWPFGKLLDVILFALKALYYMMPVVIGYCLFLFMSNLSVQQLLAMILLTLWFMALRTRLTISDVR